MGKFKVMIDRLSREMDKMAGLCIVSVMILVVGNILLRKLFKQPILGTYELVGYLTALGISLALARCAYQNGHIALDYILNRFPKKIRLVSNITINLAGLCFWSLSTWHLFKYAQSLKASGVVSPSAQIPVYPVVLFIGLGFMGLCLVLLLRFFEFSETLLADLKTIKRPCQAELVAYVKEGR